MPIKVTKDGVRVVRSFKSYIGKDVIETINELEEKRSFIKVMDCVGLNGYRNITMWRNEHHIEIHYCPIKFHQSESWRSSSGF